MDYCSQNESSGNFGKSRENSINCGKTREIVLTPVSGFFMLEHMTWSLTLGSFWTLQLMVTSVMYSSARKKNREFVIFRENVKIREITYIHARRDRKASFRDCTLWYTTQDVLLCRDPSEKWRKISWNQRKLRKNLGKGTYKTV